MQASGIEIMNRPKQMRSGNTLLALRQHLLGELSACGQIFLVTGYKHAKSIDGLMGNRSG